MGDAADKFGDLHAAHDIALGILDGLAVLDREQFGQLVHVGVDEIDKAEEYPRPALRIGGGPARLRSGGGLDGRFEVVGIGQRDFGGDFARCRIEDIRGPARLAHHMCSVDEMSDGFHARSSKFPRENECLLL